MEGEKKYWIVLTDESKDAPGNQNTVLWQTSAQDLFFRFPYLQEEPDSQKRIICVNLHEHSLNELFLLQIDKHNCKFDSELRTKVQENTGKTISIQVTYFYTVQTLYNNTMRRKGKTCPPVWLNVVGPHSLHCYHGERLEKFWKNTATARRDLGKKKEDASSEWRIVGLSQQPVFHLWDY